MCDPYSSYSNNEADHDIRPRVVQHSRAASSWLERITSRCCRLQDWAHDPISGYCCDVEKWLFHIMNLGHLIIISFPCLKDDGYRRDRKKEDFSFSVWVSIWPCMGSPDQSDWLYKYTADLQPSQPEKKMRFRPGDSRLLWRQYLINGIRVDYPRFEAGRVDDQRCWLSFPETEHRPLRTWPRCQFYGVISFSFFLYSMLPLLQAMVLSSFAGSTRTVLRCFAIWMI